MPSSSAIVAQAEVDTETGSSLTTDEKLLAHGRIQALSLSAAVQSRLTGAPGSDAAAQPDTA